MSGKRLFQNKKQNINFFSNVIFCECPTVDYLTLIFFDLQKDLEFHKIEKYIEVELEILCLKKKITREA